MSSRTLITTDSPFERQAGYSRAVVDGEWVFVAGTTGFDYVRQTIDEDAAEQTRQALRNIEQVLAQADARPADIVRARYMISDAALWPIVAPVLGDWFADIRPAATCIVCGLVDPRMKVEIEVTARRK
jgi:enamine deaminase RidA (YjgF/YER057c/UK114 family)